MKTATTPRIPAMLGALAAFSFTALFAQAHEQEQQQSTAPQITQPAATTTATQEPPPASDSGAIAPAAKKNTKRSIIDSRHKHTGNETMLLNVGSDINVPAGKIAGDATAIFGSITANAPVNDTVSIIGSTTINAKADDVVAVIGNVYVNGHVKGDVVAVIGGVELGPDARVDGDVIALGGSLKKAETASIGGDVVRFKMFNNTPGFNAWVTKALSRGSLLAFGAGLAWVWLIAGIFLLVYIITAALFPKAVTACAETLELHPGTVFLAAFVTVFIRPIVSLVLAATGIGLLVLIPASLALAIFGKTAILAWIGRRITIPLKLAQHPVLAVFIGGVVLALLYCVPVLGILLWKLTGFLGTGAVVYAVILALRRRRAERAAANPNPVPPIPPPITGEASAALASRAGFWMRAGALLIDGMIVWAIAIFLLRMAINPVVLFAIYCVIMWGARGTTLGGIVCGLKIVRADGRELDWSTALVRALGGFVAMLPFGLGFFWVGIDADRQGWHDKIAGTIVVHAPKGQSLV